MDKQSEYNAQLTEKTTRIKAQFQPHFTGELAVFSSPIEHFRARSEFRIWHEGEQCFYAMFKQGEKANSGNVILMQDFPVASKAINELMPRLLEHINANDALKNRLFQCEFLSTLSGDMLVTLIYHKKLDEAWEIQAKELMAQLGIHLIGRSRKQKIVLSQDYVTESLDVTYSNRTHIFKYKQIEGGFTQPNPHVCQLMLSWAASAAGSIEHKGDLLELYCGNGNFTLPLSKQFKRVLATEISKTSVNAAKWNIEQNGINNIEIARLSSDEFTQAFTGQRVFERLQRADIDLNTYQFNTVFVDPPRAGVDENTLKLIQQFDHIIYISCNPDTLLDNLNTLSHTHRVERMALFDQFPYTHHVETGVLLSKRS